MKSELGKEFESTGRKAFLEKSCSPDGIHYRYCSEYTEWLENKVIDLKDKIERVKLKMNRIEDILPGDSVLYVGTYLGTVQKDRAVLLRDKTIIESIDSQRHKFRKVLY
jgi:hypothetical protein